MSRAVLLGQGAWALAMLAGCAPRPTAPPGESVVPTAIDAAVPPAGRRPDELATTSSPPAPLAPGVPAPEVEGPPRDARSGILRDRSLLIAEVQAAERLYARTPEGSPDRLRLERLLAETYVELGKTALRDRAIAERARDGQRESDPKGSERQQGLAKQADQIVKTARRRAIALYTLLKDAPAYAERDAALYYLGLEHERADDLAAARATYLELIRAHPSSPFTAGAYLAFAELFFDEARGTGGAGGDPSKWALAARAYEKVLAHPPPQNTFYAYAWYKLGYVVWCQGELARALEAFRKVAELGGAAPQLPRARELAASARRNIAQIGAVPDARDGDLGRSRGD